MRPPILRLRSDELIVDNFAGGGGASTGIEMATGRSPDIAINHDPEALAMHAANHPSTRHLCESVWKVDPVEVCGGRPVGLAWFSPDCTFHSKARGAKPFRDRDAAKRRRGLAWVVTRWARAVRPRLILLENVEEFQDWGPLLDDGTPDPLRRGFTFRRWRAQLQNLGYHVEERQLRACDFGAPTSRKRLVVLASLDGPPSWPVPTHGKGRLPYRTAAECIDWTIPCPSIFDRKRPLAENTLRRIARGIRRYVLEAAQPFIVPVTHHGDARVHGVDEPMRTITTAQRGEHALITPYIARTAHGEQDSTGKRRGRGEHSLGEPLPTVLTTRDYALVAPTLIQTGYGERTGQAPRTLDLHKPLGTIISGGTGGNGKHALVAAFIAKHYGDPDRKIGGGAVIGQQIEIPMATVTVREHLTLVTSHLAKLYGTCADGQPVDEPMPTVTATGTHIAEVRAFLISYYGSDQNPQLNIPLPTVTTKHRLGLVTIHGVDYAIVDIGMRMLEPRELFRAQGFADAYEITPLVNGKPLTKTAQVRMCGNSVCPPLAAALVTANLADEARAEVVA